MNGKQDFQSGCGLVLCGTYPCDCDNAGPKLLLLHNAPYEIEDTPENQNKYKDQIFGESVSCSKCGNSAYNKGFWD